MHLYSHAHTHTHTRNPHITHSHAHGNVGNIKKQCKEKTEITHIRIGKSERLMLCYAAQIYLSQAQNVSRNDNFSHRLPVEDHTRYFRLLGRRMWYKILPKLLRLHILPKSVNARQQVLNQ